VTVKEIESFRAQQKHSSLLTEAAQVNSEGAKAQFLAFAKVKAEISDARRLLKAGNKDEACKALDKADKVIDLRLDLIKRVDTLPGGSAAAMLYEKKMNSSIDKKCNKAWDQSVQDVKAKRNDKSEDKSAGKARSRFEGSNRFPTDIISPFVVSLVCWDILDKVVCLVCFSLCLTSLYLLK
jgi:hypothetical protein